ncbi:MAG: hypothetical protein AAGJ35_01025 [Myxococcota bacterium]
MIHSLGAWMFLGGLCLGVLCGSGDAAAEQLLGEQPKQVIVMKKRKRTCYRYANWTLVKTQKWLFLKKGTRRRLCVKGKAKLYVKFSDQRTFRGFVYPYLFVREDLGSDWFQLEIFSERMKGKVHTLKSLPPNATVSYDAKRQGLVFGKELKFPRSCAKKMINSDPERTYIESEKVCWPHLQRKYRVLRGVKRPGCTCGGLMPYISASYLLPLRSPYTPRLLGNVKCGCAS